MIFRLPFLSIWLAFHSNALYTPIVPSIIQQPANASTSTRLVEFRNWPAVPWIYYSSSSPSVIDFISYGRQVNPRIWGQIIDSFDMIILKVLLLPDNKFNTNPWQQVDGIVRVSVGVSRWSVRATSVALALQQIRDLMGNEYGPREIGQANLILQGDAAPAASMEVVFSRVE